MTSGHGKIPLSGFSPGKAVKTFFITVQYRPVTARQHFKFIVCIRLLRVEVEEKPVKHMRTNDDDYTEDEVVVRKTILATAIKNKQKSLAFHSITRNTGFGQKIHVSQPTT